MLTLTTKQTLSIFIFTTLMLSPSLVTASCNYGTCESASQRLQRSRILSESAEMEINPGVTQELQIQLKGQTEGIVVSFKAEESDMTRFLITVLTNLELTSSDKAHFTERETLKVTLNYDSKQCKIIGSKGFSFTLPIKDSSYEITVDKDRASTVIIEDGYDLIKVTSHENLNGTIGAVVTVGCCIIALLGVRMFLAAKKSKNLLVEELDETTNSQDTSKKADNEAAMYSKVNLKQQEITTPGSKDNTSLIKDFNVVLDNEVTNQVKLNTSKDSTKKTDANTILSTAHTLSAVPNLRLIGVGSLGNIKSIHEESGFVLNGNEIVKADFHHNKNREQDVGSIIIESPAASPFATKAFTFAHKKHTEQDHGSIILESPAASPFGTKAFAFPHKKHTEIGMDLALSMDMFEKDGTTVPTITAIKDLVKKMKEEGTIGIEEDPSVDSDDEEDQYEAPQLPNYTCCMLCFQGSRCTVVEPCRHVFACVDCVEELLDSYKICVLCANQITEYGMLADE